MKLRRLAIERLPGIDRPFALESLGDGLNLIVGPNGTGKTRLCAATQALLWREREIKDGGLAASALFDHEGVAWRVACEGSQHRWQRAGVDSEPPALPGVHLHACFFLGLRDLLDDADDAGRDLAGVIRRQMSGGFDLDAVQRPFEQSLKKSVGRIEARALAAADRDIRKAEQTQATILQEEEELESLGALAQRAERAQRRLVHYDEALALVELRAAHALCEAEIARLPEALARLDGKELEQLDGLQSDLGEKRAAQEEARAALAECRVSVREARLDEPIDSTRLATWRARAEHLAELEHALDVARQAADGAHAVLRARRRVLGGRAPTDPDAVLAIDDDFDLFAFLRESQRLAIQRRLLEERLKLLGERAFPEERERRLERLRRAVDALRTWLRVPDPSAVLATTRSWPSRIFYCVAGLLSIALGGGLWLAPGLAELAHPALPPAGLALGAGLLLAGLLTRVRVAEHAVMDARAVALQQLPAAFDPPSEWTTEAVTERLHGLEGELAELEAEKVRARDRGVERSQLEPQLLSLAGPEAEMEARRDELTARLALETPLDHAELVDLARALDALREAHGQAREAAAKLEALEAQWRQELAEIASFAVELGESEPTDAASARASVHALESRDRSLRAARERAKREEQALDRLEREIEKLATAQAEIFRRAAVEGNDRSALARLLADPLHRYRELVRARDEHASGIKRAELALGAADESALADLAVDRLKEQRTALARDAEALSRARQEIGRISERVRSAREGHDLEDALARRSAALEALRARRDEVLAAAGGRLLIEGIRAEHESNQMPRVLERARHHLGTFTHQRYELNVSPHEGDSFVAVDVKSGAGLSPDRLSDGTRAQLILAARLAFAEEAEQGADLPLFLDEALDHSDPDRFHAIARSLARMIADEGRQVFYLSNDPTDVDRFRAAFEEEGCEQIQTIDLGVIRGRMARVDGPDALHVAPLASVPRPTGAGAEAYGVAIGVAALDPARTAHAQDVYYLLRDDLALLHTLLEARIETVGQCRNLLKSTSPLARQLVAASGAGSQLEARIALFETFCRAWCEGRGTPVGRAEIEQSGAVTDTYLDAVVEFAAEIAGDAARLVDALRQRSDPRFKGFRDKAADELSRYLVENGHIDARPILGEREIIERAIGTPAAHRIGPATAAALLHEWWTLCERAAAS